MAKTLRGQQGLFEPMQDTGDWAPPSQLPDLSRHKEVWLDCETTGNNKRKDKPVGIAIATTEGGTYLPFGHREGGNLDEALIKRWAETELRGKRIANLNTGFDADTMLNWGVDLEAQGCTLHDVAHTAALLNENRYGGFNLDDLGKEYVGRGKEDSHGIKPENYWKAHSSLIGPYAIGDALLARDVDIAQRPFVAADDLGQVERLEDELIWANNFMERCGMRMDVPKLEDWRRALDEEYSELAMRIWSETGVKMYPNKQTSWSALFDKCGLKRNATGETKLKGKYEVVDVESYTDDFLKKVQQPLVQFGLRMRRLSSLKSKYLDKYWKAMVDGVLYYHLYQLRAGEDDYGTVVGRWSSANVNVQQVFKVENQIKRFGDGYIIRELMIPDDGFDMFSTDGSQLQFRLFAHYSRDPCLIDAYKNNPNQDFHDLVAELFHLDRQAAKHNNFGKVLGMGNEKLCDRLGLSCTCKPRSWWSRETRAGLEKEEKREHLFGINSNHASGCRAREGNSMATKYDEEFPAAKQLMEEITALADPDKGRGYIKTLLGRRRRYKRGDKFYSAFAGLLQGSEADVVKKLVNHVYKERKTVGVHKLRAPVHDEIVGDIDPDPVLKARYKELCAEERIPLKVPLIWKTGYGRNWKECK